MSRANAVLDEFRRQLVRTCTALSTRCSPRFQNFARISPSLGFRESQRAYTVIAPFILSCDHRCNFSWQQNGRLGTTDARNLALYALKKTDITHSISACHSRNCTRPGRKFTRMPSRKKNVPSPSKRPKKSVCTKLPRWLHSRPSCAVSPHKCYIYGIDHSTNFILGLFALDKTNVTRIELLAAASGCSSCVQIRSFCRSLNTLLTVCG